MSEREGDLPVATQLFNDRADMGVPVVFLSLYHTEGHESSTGSNNSLGYFKYGQQGLISFLACPF